MRLCILIALLAHTVQHIAGQDGIAFQDRTLLEGDRCMLANGRPGQCRVNTACTTNGGGAVRLCRSDGSRLVVCCDVVQQQCNSVNDATTPRIADHIVGVTYKADDGEFPFIALIIYSNPEFRCGASIISDKFLLSAAHCFPKEIVPTHALVGTTEAGDHLAATYNISRVIRHAKYARRQHDIALVELRSNIKMTLQVQPICLYTGKEELSEAQNLTVIGWGKDNSEEVSQVLLKGFVRPISRSECYKRFNPQFVRLNITEGHLCALGDVNEEGTATDACQGDSGGPLVINENGKHFLVGVVSSGSACGGTELAGVYTWVSRYVEWLIEQKTWRRNPRLSEKQNN